MRPLVVYFTISLVLMVYFAFDSLGQRLENQRLVEQLEINELDCSMLKPRSK